MQDFTSDEIQETLDKITDSHSGNDGFVSVEYTKGAGFIVRYRDMRYKPSAAPDSVEVFAVENNKTYAVPLIYEVGPVIIESFGHVEEHPPFEAAETLEGEMGGDQCRNANSMDYYGTITFYITNIAMQATGRCNLRCSVGPAMVSNNHVIGRSDVGRTGEVIWTPFRAVTARLECLIPFSCHPDVDVAFAKVNNMSGIHRWTVRTIGRLNNVRRPNIGEAIKKYGARTGFTTGNVTGQANIRVGSYTFRGVFSTTGGFGCPGDSGSAVASSNNDLIGVFSWADSVPCDRNPRGYFWTFINPGRFSSDPSRTSVGVTISDDCVP